MTGFIIGRFLQALLALFGVSVLTFFLIFAAGDPAVLLLPPNAQGPEEIAALKAQLGLDRPLVVQYWDFFINAVQGDFGQSLRYGVPASELVISRLPATVELTLSAIFIAIVIGVPLGIVAATRKGSRLDRAIVILSGLTLAAPTFWIGAMLIAFFAVYLQWLPPSGRSGWGAIILPAITLAMAPLPVLVRFSRSGMIDVLSKDYMRTARARGISEGTLIMKYALRNTLIPIVTIIGLETGALLGGAVVTEAVFAWPGIGQLAVGAAINRDIPVVLAVVLLASAVFLLVNLIIDIAYTYLNPVVGR